MASLTAFGTAQPGKFEVLLPGDNITAAWGSPGTLSVRAHQTLVIACVASGAPEGRGACNWPPRVVLKGSTEGAAQVELRGLIMHDHTHSGNGGVITTNGDTLLMIANASFVRNEAASVAPRET